MIKQRKRLQIVAIVAGLVLAGIVTMAMGALLGNFSKLRDVNAGDWLQFFGGMIGASLTVSGAYWLEKRRTELGLRRERTEATEEILSTTNEALEIYGTVRTLLTQEDWDEDGMSTARARAEHLYLSLDRLISRPFLTDGAIITGAGAMTVVRAIAGIPSLAELQREVKGKPGRSSMEALVARISVSARPDAERVVAALQATVQVVKLRAARVRRHHLPTTGK